MVKSRGYQGQGPEVVIVGFEEICPLGLARHKHSYFREDQLDVTELALKMGVLEYRENTEGKRQLFEVKALPADLSQAATPYPPEQCLPIDDTSSEGMQDFRKRWESYVRQHTGLRALTLDNAVFDPRNFSTLRAKRKRLEQVSEEQFQFLKSLDLQIEDIEKGGGSYNLTVVTVVDQPFPFEVDFGGPLPTGWRFDNLGLPPKELKKMNYALLLVYETAYRVLLDATLHPAQDPPTRFFDPKDLALHGPTGMGPMFEIEYMGYATVRGDAARPKQLCHGLANTVLGYVAPSLNFRGKISTHVGACESVMGGIAEAYRDLKARQFEAAMVVGYDWAMGAVSYNGFISAGAMITNERLLKVAKALLEANAIDDETLVKQIRERLAKQSQIESELHRLDERHKAKEIADDAFRREKQKLHLDRQHNLQNLPKGLYERASMPFHPLRNGFVMSVGAGGCFMTTLDHAIELGLPIRCFVAGCGEKVPDGPGDGFGSIALLGDGVGEAFERSFLETRENYQVQDAKSESFRELTIEDIGAWWAHGTSTPNNGYGERREAHRILSKYGRSVDHPLLFSGDKEIGHRIGGNFPSEAIYALEQREICPLRNYSMPDPELEKNFFLTRIVGKAGEGQGKRLPLRGDFIAINGAGFGKINSNLIFKAFDLNDLHLTDAQRSAYQQKCAARLEASRKLQEQIKRGEILLIQ